MDTFTALMDGFAVALSIKNLLLGLLGVTLGTAIGVLPGVGPALTIALLACGALLVREALTGGFREIDPPSGAEQGHWPGFVWVSAGILLNALLITRIGFVLACALCFMLAVRGFKSAEGRLDLSPRAWLTDLAVGAAIAAPVYWMFGKLLAINLPGLTQTGWI